MRDKKKLFGTLFLAVSIIGTAFVAAEILMESLGKTICLTEGCTIVARQTRFGDVSILLLGLLTFSSLAVLSFLSRRSGRERPGNLLSMILIVALAGEGFFTGYQAFRIHVFCFFCLTVFGLLCTLGVIRILSGDRQVITGFLSMAAVLGLFYLVLPAGEAVKNPGDKELILFYSSDCKYCQELMKELEEHGIAAEHLLAGEYSAFLKNVGIDHVPALLVNRKNERVFLTGKEAIDGYLFCKPGEKESTTNLTSDRGSKSEKKPSSGQSAPPGKNLLIGPDEKSQNFFAPPAGDEGMCKENVKCE